VTLSDSGSREQITAAIRRAALTGQARRRLLQALERPDEPRQGSPITIIVN
jgi:hypothetical protein